MKHEQWMRMKGDIHAITKAEHINTNIHQHKYTKADTAQDYFEEIL